MRHTKHHPVYGWKFNGKNNNITKLGHKKTQVKRIRN